MRPRFSVLNPLSAHDCEAITPKGVNASIFFLNFEPVTAKKKMNTEYFEKRSSVSVDTRTEGTGQTLGFHGEQRNRLLYRPIKDAKNPQSQS